MVCHEDESPGKEKRHIGTAMGINRLHQKHRNELVSDIGIIIRRYHCIKTAYSTATNSCLYKNAKSHSFEASFMHSALGHSDLVVLNLFKI